MLLLNANRSQSEVPCALSSLQLARIARYPSPSSPTILRSPLVLVLSVPFQHAPLLPGDIQYCVLSSLFLPHPSPHCQRPLWRLPLAILSNQLVPPHFIHLYRSPPTGPNQYCPCTADRYWHRQTIVDPLKVARTALIEASGVTSRPTASEASIVEAEEKQPPADGMGGIGARAVWEYGQFLSSMNCPSHNQK
ncbi:hypothetical protein JB92DRAFT_3125813 [Gautieria morchelliformis]|nr:hypothetical protein JB92DRAFT_3125813 [Gautieria morchelliformis]